MTAVIVEIHKRKYVCGLFWQSLSQPRELQAEARELAGKLNFDLAVLRKDLGMAQAGFASTREGAQAGMLSLGALVASHVAAQGVQHGERRQPAANWLAALRLPDERWAYLAVRDESFLPSGDFAGSRAEVLERLYADYGLGGWNAVIGDAELADQGLHHFSPATLDDFLPRNTRRRPWLASAWELAPVQRSRRALALAGVAVLGVAAVAGSTVWVRRHAELEAAERQRALMTAQQRRAAEQTPEAPPPPWLGQPAPRDLARACARDPAPMAPGGWQLDEVACTRTQRTTSWSRGGSTVAYLMAQLPQARIELDGETARWNQPLSAPPAPVEPLQPASALLPALSASVQQLGLKVAFKPMAVAAPASGGLPGVRQAPPPAPPPWQAYALSLQSGGLPLAALADALSRPGVRLKTLTLRQGEWFIEGVVYAM